MTGTARIMVAAVVAGLLAAVALPAVGANPAVAAPAKGPTFTQSCGGSSWWAGSVNICNGSLVYRDYVYDDAGMDEGDIGDESGTQSAYGTLAHPAGDVRYPADAITTADLVALTLTRVGDRIDVVAELNALYTADSTILALAVDSDGDPTTGGGAWDELGVSSTGWDDLHTFAKGNPGKNLIRGSFPLPDARRFRVQAVTAQADGRVMNVAFRGVDEQASYRQGHLNPSPYPPSGQGAWFEDDQAAALAAGDISRFGVDVDVADLRRGVERRQRIGPGLHERVYTSKYVLPIPEGQPRAGQPGEGMTYAGIRGRGSGGSATAFAQVFNFMGRYQPYGIYIPDAAGPYGLQMEWHGSNQGLVAQINTPGMQADFGDGLNRLLVAPLARGPNGYGSDISERDLLDVMADVTEHLPVDTDRVFSSGYSQGGYVAWRMAMLHPDRFAGYTSWVGFTGNTLNGTPLTGTVDITAGAVGNMIDYVGNLRHVGGSMLFGAADELIPASSAVAMERAFAATDSPYLWYMHSAADHFAFALLDQWEKEAEYSKDQRVALDPARITFRTNRFLWDPAHGIRHDRAYWVSKIRGRDKGFIDIDLTTYGCGGKIPELAAGTGAGPSPVPWVSTSKDVTGTTDLPVKQRLEGTLDNVASLVLDLDAACLRAGFDYKITSDGPAVLHLGDGTRLTLEEGVNTRTSRRGGGRPAGADGADPDGTTPPGTPPTLPATGGSQAAPLVGVTLLGFGYAAARTRARRLGQPPTTPIHSRPHAVVAFSTISVGGQLMRSRSAPQERRPRPSCRAGEGLGLS